MQKAISNKIQLGDTLNPLNDYARIPSPNDEGNLENLIQKVDKVGEFWKTGKADAELSRYFPNNLPATRPVQIADELPRKVYASVTCLDKKQLEFVLDLTANTYTNWSSMEICLPLKFTKKTNKAQQMDTQMITVNIFLGHWFTDIDIRRYPGDTRILPTNNSVDIYQYSNTQLKYLPEKSVKTLLKTMLYSNKPVHLDKDVDRRPNNSHDNDKRTDPNLTYRIKEVKDCLFQKHVYRVPLGLIVILITLEREMNKLFETNKKLAAFPAMLDALINIYDRPYISYQELKVTETSGVYLSVILRSETVLRLGVLPSPYQELFEINTGTQRFTCTFKGGQRHFDWLEISVVYNKSYQHMTIYDSYDLELAAQLIQTIKFENTSTTYSITGKLFFDLKKDKDKNVLYKMLVVYNCEGCSSVPLMQSRNNKIYQEMTEEDEFTTNSKDDSILVDMRRSKGYTDELQKLNRDDSGLAVVITLKEVAAKKLRLRVTGFSEAE